MGMKTLCALMVATRLVTASGSSSSSTRTVCQDIVDLGVLDGEIDLGTATSIECPANEDKEDLSEILVKSGTTLTLKSTQSPFRFINVRFTLEKGATLIFDMPETAIGPNHEETDVPNGYVFGLYDNASLTFTGDFQADAISNAGHLFENQGDAGISIEFKGDSHFTNNRCNVFDRNSGSLKFRGEALFEANNLLGIVNFGEDGFVRFSKTATFIDNGDGFDGAAACGMWNYDGGKVSFRGDAVFSNHRCREGTAVDNRGKMRFYGKAYFNDNINNGETGGAFVNSGDLVFRGAVQLNRNTATYAGGFYTRDGSTTFKKRVTMRDNGARENGGAFYATGGTLTFERPDKVVASGNYIYGGQTSGGVVQVATGCSLAYVTDDATMVGFPFDDACQEMTV